MFRLIVPHRLESPPPQQRVEERNEDQRGAGAHRNAAEDGASQRGVLFGSLAEADCHRQQAYRHRARGHQHRPQTRRARLRTLVGLERRAFNLGDGLDGNDRAPDVPVTDDRLKAALALLLAKEPKE